ncbi:MAG: DUF6624 domain-containing protein [Flavobacteriales bacterium]
MKNILILITLFSLTSCENGEKKGITKEPSTDQKAKYAVLTDKASQLYSTKDYQKSAQKFSEAFKVLGDKSTTADRYNAACSWALANQIDSSYVQLFKAAEKGGYSKYNHIIADTDLSNLHSHKNWKKLLEIIKKNKEKKEVNFDKSLIVILDSVYLDDQSIRWKFFDDLEKYGQKSDEFKATVIAMNKQDSINIIKIEKILDQHGWLGEDVIGEDGNRTLFFVIQHAELKVQEKYLPMLREAVKNKNAKPSQLALLEDRIAMRNGKEQTYGSQTKIDDKTGEAYFTPIKDPENVDIRRANVGLPPMSEYAKTFNIIWDIEEHKKMKSEKK